MRYDARRVGLALAACLLNGACSGRIDDQPPGMAMPPDRSPASEVPPLATPAPSMTPVPPTTTPTPRPPEPPPAQVDLKCDAALGAPPRRVWRLTAEQYLNTVTVFLGRRNAHAAQPPRPNTTLVAPLDADSEGERFRNFASLYAMSEYQTRRAMASAGEIAAALVGTLRKTTSSCLGATVNRPPFATCMKSVVEERGALLFSRPLAPDEVNEYVALATTAVGTVGEDEAAALALQAMLVSPSFLFRVEVGAGPPDAQGRVRLSPYEIASALSYTLADGPPDVELWRAAGAGELSTADQVRAQAARLVGTFSAKSKTTVRFLREFFRYGEAPRVFKDVRGHNADALVADTERLVGELLTAHGSSQFLRHLLTSPTVMAQRDTAMAYGVTWTPPPPNVIGQPYEVPAQRAGLLTQPSFLVAFSESDHNNPVKRGLFVAESLLCQTVPQIPIGVVPALPDDPKRTVRERLAQHGADPGCAACHRLMDHLGLAFETYDHIGRWREHEAERPVDASGVLIGAGEQDGPYRNALELMRRLGTSSTVEDCFVRHSFRYWMGRNEQSFDGCALMAALDAYRRSNGDYRALLLALVTSPSFLTRSVR